MKWVVSVVAFIQNGAKRSHSLPKFVTLLIKCDASVTDVLFSLICPSTSYGAICGKLWTAYFEEITGFDIIFSLGNDFLRAIADVVREISAIWSKDIVFEHRV